MAILMDTVVLILFVLSAFRGYKKGFIDMILKLIGFILILFISFYISQYIAKIVYNREVGRNLENKIQQTLFYSDGRMKENSQNVTKDIMHITKFIDKDNKTQLEISKAISAQIAKRTIHITIFLIVLFVSAIAMILVRGAINKIVSLIPIVSGINRLSGMIVSIVFFLLILSSILYVVKLMEYSQKNLVSVINKTHITKYIYENNAISKTFNIKEKLKNK